MEEWVRNNENKLVRKRIIEIEDTPEITSELVKDIIKSFREKAPGPTGITRNLLLNANNKIFERYAEIFTACLATGCFPASMKRARVVMVPKAGKNPSSIENYRPISLLEIPGKILEKIINYELIYHLEDKNILNPRQHGFRKGRGTDTAIALAHESISKSLSDNRMVTVVLRDVKGAFDKVWFVGVD